jgi:hypothetical protein
VAQPDDRGWHVTDASTQHPDDGVWDRLRRRKVVQWSVAYVAAAWALLQGIGFVADSFAWPGAVKQLATLTLLIGLPITLVLAWYHGDRGQQRFSAIELTILALIVMVGGGGIFWRYERAPQASREGSPEPALVAVQLAVLPFQMANPDPASDYLALAVPDAITTRLANLRTLRIRPTPPAAKQLPSGLAGRSASITC